MSVITGGREPLQTAAKHVPSLMTILLFLFSCGGEEYGALGVAVRFASPAVEECADDGAPVGKGKLPCGADKFRLCVSGEGIEKTLCEDFDLEGAEKGFKMKVPAGKERVVSLKAYNDTGSSALVIWCGASARVRVFADRQNPVDVFLTLCNDFTLAYDSSGGGRAFHQATLLDDGRVLVTGGMPGLDTGSGCGQGCKLTKTALSTAVIFDPDTGHAEGPIQMKAARSFHSAVLLENGNVLVSGGAETVRFRTDGSGFTVCPESFGTAGGSAEVFNAASGAFESLQAAMRRKRMLHQTAAVRDGALLFGGVTEAAQEGPEGGCAAADVTGSAETFKIADGSFTLSRYGMQVPRQSFVTAGYSRSGFLVFGGGGAGYGNEEAVEALDGVALSFRFPPFNEASSVGPLQAAYAAGAAATDGSILVAGGMFVDEKAGSPAFLPIDSARLFTLADGVLGVSDVPGGMIEPRAFHAAAALPGSGIALFGGAVARGEGGGFSVTDSAELWDPETFEFAALAGKMREPRAGHVAVSLDNGYVLLSGGLPLMGGAAQVDASTTMEVFNPEPNSL